MNWIRITTAGWMIHGIARLVGALPFRALLCATACVVALHIEAAGFDHTHSKFAPVLERHVRDGLVDYPALKSESGPLDAYLDELGAVPEADFMKFTEPEKIAFLINLYNASALKLVITHYPIQSVKEIGGWLSGPFDQRIVRLMGRTFSLGDVEHAILRRNHNEPRIHFALVCASLGCPPLRAEPYVTAHLDEQLDDQGRRFLADRSRGNHVDVKNRTLYLSKTFKWFDKDFLRKAPSVSAFVAPYLPKESAEGARADLYKIVHTEYDWSLNDRKHRKVPDKP